MKTRTQFALQYGVPLLVLLLLKPKALGPDSIGSAEFAIVCTLISYVAIWVYVRMSANANSSATTIPQSTASPRGFLNWLVTPSASIWSMIGRGFVACMLISVVFTLPFLRSALPGRVLFALGGLGQQLVLALVAYGIYHQADLAISTSIRLFATVVLVSASALFSWSSSMILYLGDDNLFYKLHSVLLAIPVTIFAITLFALAVKRSRFNST
jgi:hypothetical protein